MNAWKVILIVVGCILLITGGIVGLGAVFLLTARDIEVTPEDRALLVTPADLEEYFDYTHDPEHVQVSKIRYLDRTTELTMEYDVEEDDDQPYMNVTVSHEHKRSDARSTYGISWGAQVMSMNVYDDNVDVVEANDLFSIGDRSRFGFICYDGMTTGVMLVCMKGNNIYDVTLSGFFIDDPEILHELFDDKLAHLDSFK